MRADAKRNHDQLLAVARELITVGGAKASLRDIARTAGVGLGTLQRHFPTREALLDALLRVSFDELAVKAGEFERRDSATQALVTWVREASSVAHRYTGAISLMVAAIADENSALHASCVAMRAAGTNLLVRAQAEGKARADIDGTDLFALIGALAWISDQPALAPRSDHLFEIMASALLTDQAA